MAQAQRAENDDNAQQTAPAGAAKRPVVTIRDENVEVAIWANPSSNGTFYNATFSRKYKDSEGKTHNTDSCRERRYPRITRSFETGLWRDSETAPEGS
jgi:hypothetical protein